MGTRAVKRMDREAPDRPGRIGGRIARALGLSSAWLAAALLLASAWDAHATPANSIKAHYDTGRGELHVTVEHFVTDRSDHFIERVSILRGGEEIASRRFDFQTSRRNQTMPPFRISAGPGDLLRIVAVDNRGFSYDQTIPIPDAR